MADINQVTKEVVNESRLNAIDALITAFNLDSLLSYIKQQRATLKNALSLYENNKWFNKDIEAYSLSHIRTVLKTNGYDLHQLGLEGYYFIEKLKETFAKEEFTYTLGAVSAHNSQVQLEKVSNLSLREFMGFLYKDFGRTSSATGAQAILAGRVTLTKLTQTSKATSISDKQAQLFQRLWSYGIKRGIKKGVIFEAFEYALAEGVDNVKNIYYIRESTFQKYIQKASGNVPFFTFHGDVKGAQVKFGGFTLAHINTIYGVLEYLYVILAAMKANKKGLTNKLIKTVFRGTDARTIEKNFQQIVNSIVDKELKELIQDFKNST